MGRTMRRIGAVTCLSLLMTTGLQPFAATLRGQSDRGRSCVMPVCRRSVSPSEEKRFEMDAARTAAGLAAWLPALLPLIVEGVQTGGEDPQEMSVLRASRSFTEQAILSALAASFTALGKLTFGQGSSDATAPASDRHEGRKASSNLA